MIHIGKVYRVSHRLGSRDERFLEGNCHEDEQGGPLSAQFSRPQRSQRYLHETPVSNPSASHPVRADMNYFFHRFQNNLTVAGPFPL